MIEVLGGFVFVYVLYTLGKAVYNVYFHPLSKFPGPKSWAASPIPVARATIAGTLVMDIKDLNERYGEVVRISPDTLVYTSASALRDIYTRQPATESRPSRPPMQKSSKAYFAPPGGVHSIVTVKDDADHSRYRRLLSHAFSDKALREQEPLIQRYVDLFIFRLQENSKNGAQDMLSWYNFVTFDIIGDLTLGESFECLQKSSLHPWVSILFSYLKISAYLSAISNFPLLHKILMPLIPRKITDQRKKHFLFTKERVEKRMAQGTERPDFMSNVMRHNDKETGMTTDEIIPTFAILLVAGSETTATALSATTFYLCKYPKVYAKITKEIRASFTSEDEITMVSVNKLKYTIAVLDEALRIFPPAPPGGQRTVPLEGEIISGRWVPGGTQVKVQLYSAHRVASNWEHPDEFVPERWLGDERYKSDDRGTFAPFSVGPRNCIGINLAYAEMKLILARLLWNFDLELEERSSSWMDEMKSFLLWEKQSLYVKLNPVERGLEVTRFARNRRSINPPLVMGDAISSDGMEKRLSILKSKQS